MRFTAFLARFVSVAVVLAFLASASPAMAFLIDDFETGDFALNDPDTPVSVADSVATGGFQGERDAYVELTDDSDAGNEALLEVGGGLLGFATFKGGGFSTVTGLGILQWDFEDVGAAPTSSDSTDNLAYAGSPINIIAGDNNILRINFGSLTSDGVELLFTFWSGSNAASEYSFDTPTGLGSGGTVDIPALPLVATKRGDVDDPADFTAIQAITLEIIDEDDTEAQIVRIDSIEIVPEPASFAIFGAFAGMGLVAGRFRKRRKGVPAAT